ncbi:putative transposase orfA for insertion sequence element [Rhodococcus wratislaviensis IFP 2016]|nr:putative transposase orfA for insertion sequence element [Rhodococcus wratislaviensis IFP 2016]
MFERLHREVLDRLGNAGELDWTAAILDAASVRAKKGDR